MSAECVGCGISGTAVRLRVVENPKGGKYTALVCDTCRDAIEHPPAARPPRKIRVATELEIERASRHECLVCGAQLYKKEPTRPGRFPLRCDGCKAAA